MNLNQAKESTVGDPANEFSNAGPALFRIRRATAADAEAIVQILGEIAATGRYTAITEPWPAEKQRAYIEHLSLREVIHVAEAVEDGCLIGYQPLELWAATLHSMSHVGQIGTYLVDEWRGLGAGFAMFQRTVEFARSNGYLKFVIQVRASNSAGLGFYSRLGFRECGRFTRQVRIGPVEEDELMMEYFL